LNKLWNIEKHRHVTSHSILPEWQIKTDGIEKIGHQQIENCTVLTVPLADKDKVEFNPSCRSRLVIDEREIGVALTVEHLTEMYDFIALTVLPSFARFFSDAIWVRQHA
jgi:hypothetical protein